MTKTNMTHIGDFKIVSGKVYVTDPCYEKNCRGLALVENVKNGNWSGFIESRDQGRPGLIQVIHSSVHNSDRLGWILLAKNIGVDSGQAGIFDAHHYFDSNSIPSDFVPNNAATFAEAKNWNEKSASFYAACCDRTLGPSGEGRCMDDFVGGGTIPFGAVSSSGYGDGLYEVFIAKKDDEVVGVQIEFIPEVEEENCDYCGEMDCCGDCQEDEYQID